MLERICRFLRSGCILSPSTIYEGSDASAPFADEIQGKLAALAKKRSGEIESYLHDCKSSEVGVMKILLLGGPACGKSTIYKQMQIIHQDGFNNTDELFYFKGLIRRNIYTVYQQLVDGARILDIDTADVECLIAEIDSFYVQRSATQPTVSLNPNIANLIHQLWKSDVMRTVYRNRFQIDLLDCANYFMENLHRIGRLDFVPHYSDILHSREATVHIRSKSFTYDGWKMRLVDVGGQKSQRRKWLPLFDDVKVVLFVVDLTGCARHNDRGDIYDLPSTLALFKEVVTSRALKRAYFLLFLNKIDIFDEILPSIDIFKAMPSYKGSPLVEPVLLHMRQEFLEAAKPRKTVFPHETTATNTQNIQFVFRACMEGVFKKTTKATGLY